MHAAVALELFRFFSPNMNVNSSKKYHGAMEKCCTFYVMLCFLQFRIFGDRRRERKKEVIWTQHNETGSANIYVVTMTEFNGLHAPLVEDDFSKLMAFTIQCNAKVFPFYEYWIALSLYQLQSWKISWISDNFELPTFSPIFEHISNIYVYKLFTTFIEFLTNCLAAYHQVIYICGPEWKTGT